MAWHREVSSVLGYFPPRRSVGPATQPGPPLAHTSAERCTASGMAHSTTAADRLRGVPPISASPCPYPCPGAVRGNWHSSHDPHAVPRYSHTLLMGIAFSLGLILAAIADGHDIRRGEAATPGSPDGTKMAFTSDRGGNFEIYVMSADGSGQTRLTDNPADDSCPPGGRRRPRLSVPPLRLSPVSTSDRSVQPVQNKRSASNWFPGVPALVRPPRALRRPG